MGWSVVETGIFGILAIVAGAVFAWLGGFADSAYGPKPVILVCIVVLTAMAICVVTITPETVLGMTVALGSSLPDQAFLAVGVGIGASGGTLQSASRTMLIRQANPDRMTEAFGLYALSGKATSFMAPLLIGTVTYISGSQQIGVAPLIVLFALGLILLLWVKPDGDRAV